MPKKKALIIVDLQNDFCTGGSLTVPHGEDVIPLANCLKDYFDLVIATKDWHPQDHMSFAVNHPGRDVGDTILVDDITQILWPAHCVQETRGSEFHADFNLENVHQIFYKGVDNRIDSYSAFFDNEHKRATGLADFLRKHHVEQIYIMGLATEYCVKYSCLDAAHLGFEVFVIEDGCRGIELNPGDIKEAFAEMRAAGVRVIKSKEIMSVLLEKSGS